MKITIDVYEIPQIPVKNAKKITHNLTHTHFLHCTAEVNDSAAQIKNIRRTAESQVSLRSVHSQASKNANRMRKHIKINSGAAEY